MVLVYLEITSVSTEQPHLFPGRGCLLCEGTMRQGRRRMEGEERDGERVPLQKSSRPLGRCLEPGAVLRQPRIYAEEGVRRVEACRPRGRQVRSGQSQDEAQY